MSSAPRGSPLEAAAQVVTSPTPWQGGLVAISSFGFGGSNVHAIVAGCVRPKGPPPQPLPAPAPVDNPEALEGGETIIEEVVDAPPLFPPEVRATEYPLPCSTGLAPTDIIYRVSQNTVTPTDATYENRSTQRPLVVKPCLSGDAVLGRSR